MIGGLLYMLMKKAAWFILVPCLLANLLLLAEVTPSMISRFFRRLAANLRAYMASHPEEEDEPKEEEKSTASKKKKKSAEDEESVQAKPYTAPIPPAEKPKRKVFGVEDEPAPEPTMEVPAVEMKPVEVANPMGDPMVVNTATGEVLEPVYTSAAASNASAGELKLTDIYVSPAQDEAADRLAQEMENQRHRIAGEHNAAELDLSDEDRAPWEDPVEPVTAPEQLTPEEEEIASFLLDTTRESVAEDTLPEYAQEDAPAPIYRLPPLSLLSQNVNLRAEDNSEELRRNGEKLVSVLKSFRVSTEIVNISHGPTITRYELAPKEGVRVRAIANLVDDIALNLETSGVRIEAPIPGKAAVGIEVPNKTAATVYLRELLENPTFENSKSKVTCALGMDVAGDPVYLDIAKMPHLLIAGATGMGKSVCINSLIVSLLYKASPDEVKLILIDPKKVELNVYNKLPHLLVPVVNLPKKAAGSLSWAVGEMERRFELIEEVGVRDIKGYNQITANDPQKEYLPHIVIIIDELADLMMTAPDDVEESICRLAQKARAAGMHLIIGTQRPSVDVITGLIKANIPSRIAFTVASNVDSRTIIDVAGAEKLIGRGDMLYAPVGAMKPIRVQGSFVSDKEVEAVCDFIRAQTGESEYSSAIMEQIDKNAEQCGQKKKAGSADLSAGGDDDGGEIDPKFNDAVEVALEMGKISTSLLQRRLNLGYGRAAKIIDRMQACGIVSEPDGQKPRNVLISRSDWNEIKMRSE
ncbi:MAG: DNA translocase FtsK [Clostridia bacterium]|nr:DNA translocase FtsK [Clostridia bacterium]